MNQQEVANKVLEKLNLKLDQSDPLLQFVLAQSQILSMTNETISKADGLKKSNDELIKTINTLLLKPKEKLEKISGELDFEIDVVQDEIAKLAQLRNEFAKARFAPASIIAYVAAGLAAMAMFTTASYFFKNAKEYESVVQNIYANQPIIVELSQKNIKFDIKTAKTKDGNNVVVLTANSKVEQLNPQTMMIYVNK